MIERLRRWHRALRPSRPVALGLSFVLLLAAGTGLYFGFWRYHLKRFTVLAPGVFYRVAQPTEWGLRHAVEHHGVRTLVSLQLFDFRLYRGLVDFGKPDGMCESEYAKSLGIRHIQWPMGDEQCWPWPGAWELEEFYRLVDNPDNRPVLIHCMGGRHRTGTFSALFRLEYDRWPLGPTLDEMYSYSFGLPVPAQERNLRTYVPRPLPTAAEWPAVATAFGIDATRTAAEAVPVLVHQIRHDDPAGPHRRALAQYVAQGGSFATCLAARVVESSDDPILPSALNAARSALENRTTAPRDLAAAAALIADFGRPDDQRRLLELLQAGASGSAADPFYEALVCGVTNRYTPNRLAYLRPLLADRRPRPTAEAQGITYADTATIRVAAITDDLPILYWGPTQLNEDGPQLAERWLDAHPAAIQLTHLLPPLGNRTAQHGDGPLEEDTSKMRR